MHPIEDMKRILTFSALSLVVLWCAPSSAGPTTVAEFIGAVESPQVPDRKGLDSLSLEQVMERLHVPGMGIAVIKDFEIHWVKSYGVADADTGEKVNDATLFQAASISKAITATAMMKAVQEGKFSLDADINSLLLSWQLPASPFTREHPVTPRTLASHTSGLGDGFGFPGYAPGELLPTVVEILNGLPPSNVGAVLMQRPPLQAKKYSGGGYVVLQLALTDMLKHSFPDIVRNDVLQPIGMTNSAFEQPLSPSRDKNAARAHGADGKAMGPKWHVYPELAAAGLWTTPADLAKFAIEIQKAVAGRSNRVLNRTAVQEMLSPVGVGDYAVGLSLERRGQGWYFQHGGTNWGFNCFLIAHKVGGYGVVVMTNASNGQAVITEVRERVERVYGWDSLDKPIAP
jgi:CubicO group peptidase (beta-lactamase class C family)